MVYRVPFNSRPHEEVDRKYRNISLSSGLSIHDLTRRSTERNQHAAEISKLSIHDLTRRSTRRTVKILRIKCLSIHDLTRRSTMSVASLSRMDMSFNSRPHEEVDSNFYIPLSIWKPFNSRPHEEVDYVEKYLVSLPSPFNSRPHEEVDATDNVPSSARCIFQFTTSRGGRPRLYIRQSPLLSSFNSRPHEEVDILFSVFFGFGSSFQFTTSRGGRRSLPEVQAGSIRLSIHDLTRRSTRAIAIV